MISLLDDFYHVKQACSNLALSPGDRYLVSFLNCLGGESVTATRIFSLITIAITCYIILSLFFPRSNKKETISHGQLSSKGGLSKFFIYFLVLFFHPMILFPFFYASQFSTALTVLWAALAVWILLAWKNGYWPWLQVFLLTMMAFVGALIRVETNWYFSILFGTITLYRFIEQQCDIREFQDRKKKSFFTLFSKWQIILAFYLIIMVIVIHKVLQKWFFGGISTYDIVSSNTSMYPLTAYYQSQFLAIIYYYQNIILPFWHSFYGSWLDWWDFHQNWIFSLLLVFSIVLFHAATFWWSLVNKPLLFPSFKQDRLNMRFLWAAFFLFFTITAIFSALPRSDWYYPSRQYFGTFFFLIFILKATQNLKKQIQVAMIISLYFFTSTLYSIFYHYHDQLSFYKHEKMVTRDIHPFVRLDMANQAYIQGDYSTALATYYNVYKSVPLEAARVSHRAAVFWLLGVYGGHITSIKMGDTQSAKQSFNILMSSTYFMSTLACLQNPDVDLNICKDEKRRSNFCIYALNRNFPRLQQARELRISVEEYCHGPN